MVLHHETEYAAGEIYFLYLSYTPSNISYLLLPSNEMALQIRNRECIKGKYQVSDIHYLYFHLN